MEEKKLSFRVGDEYEGPLDLLLALIAKHRMNILDIEISSLLGQYMAYIRDRQERNLEVASEFLEMASRLVYIKTVSLLPKYEEEERKAKAELVGQLLEYQSCKAAAALLGDRGEGFGAFVRPQADIPMDKTYALRHPASLLARSYREAMGQVYITAALYPGGRVVITVRDKGCGIPDVKKAMEPLFTTCTTGERAGLGFAVMKELMDKVRVRSRVGEGTTVVLERTLRPRR